MNLGMFAMTAHPPERGFQEGAQWDLQMVRWADQYDFDEVWIGEHFFEPWEPCPAPDLLIAQALMETTRVRLGAGCHLLPCHHPVSLAARVAFLDHLSKGRLNFGIGAAAGINELRAFDSNNFSGENREKTEEALEIILNFWDRDKPFKHQGKYWKAERVDNPGALSTAHIFPYQKPHPPMAAAGFSPKSPSLTLAGRYGFWPLSFDMNTAFLRQNWESVEEGAAQAGRTPKRSDWRIVRPVLVADTDADAKRIAIDGFLGRYYREFFIPRMRELKALDLFKLSPGMKDEEIDVEYLSDTNWLCGSPETVARGIAKLHADVGGFGVIVMLAMDYSEQPEPWRRSMELLGREVKPRLKHTLS